MPPLLADDIALANCSPTPLRLVQLDTLANVGLLVDELDAAPVFVAAVVFALALVDTFGCELLDLCEVDALVVVVGVLDPPHAATSTATTTAISGSSRNRIPAPYS